MQRKKGDRELFPSPQGGRVLKLIDQEKDGKMRLRGSRTSHEAKGTDTRTL